MRDYRSHDVATAAVLARAEAYDNRYDGYEPEPAQETRHWNTPTLLEEVRSAVAWQHGSWGHKTFTVADDGSVSFPLDAIDDTARIASYLSWSEVSVRVAEGVLHAFPTPRPKSH